MLENPIPHYIYSVQKGKWYELKICIDCGRETFLVDCLGNGECQFCGFSKIGEEAIK